jgi:ATP:ADP antiporter, AAA family
MALSFARFRKHPVVTVMGLFGEVRPGEATTALLLTANVFLILSAYYLVKVAREPLILLGSGAEIKSYAASGQSLLLVFVASAYGWLAARMNRIVLISCVTLFFIANLLVFALLGWRSVNIGVPFFLWVGIFNVVTIAQFWSFAADTYTEEQGKRLFPIVGIGSSVGAVSGAWLAAPLIRGGTPFHLMLVSAGLMLCALGLTFAIHRREADGNGPNKPQSSPIASGNAFALVLRDRYLLVFAAMVLVLNFVTKSGDYVLDRMLLSQAADHAQRLGVSRLVYVGEFKARYFEWINTLGVVMQMFVVSRIVKYLGLRVALVLVPLASIVGYGASFVMPLVTVLFFGRVAESSLDYSLSNTTQQSLWLVTSREAKYKGKQVIDTFFKRAGDTTSAAVVWIGSHMAFGTRGFLAVNVVFSGVWILLAVLLGRAYAKRSAASAGQAQLTRAAGA